MLSERGLTDLITYGEQFRRSIPKVLGISRVSFIEFGVAGGNSLTSSQALRRTWVRVRNRD
jgi:hypothetical protein